MGKRFALVGTTLALLGCALLPTGASADRWYDWPGMKKCDAFKAKKSRGGYTIKVYASKHTSSSKAITCGRAESIQREYWNGDRSDRHYHPNGDYTTLKRFPGWRCGSGAGGGVCSSGKRMAGYQN